MVLGHAHSKAKRHEEACAAFRKTLDHPHHVPVPMILDTLGRDGEAHMACLEAA